MKILDFSLNEINGGSIEIICAKKKSKYVVKELKIFNQIIYYLFESGYLDFFSLLRNKYAFWKFLKSLQNEVASFGEAEKSRLEVQKKNPNLLVLFPTKFSTSLMFFSIKRGQLYF